MRSRLVFVVAFSVLGLFLAANHGLSQSNVSTGAMHGTVADSEHVVLPRVAVEARNPATGLERRTLTDGRGVYRFDFLPVGTYDVRAELQGFRPEVKTGIEVDLGASVRLDFTLSVGTVREEIVVSATAPIVEASRPDVANAVAATQIADLPLLGRNFLDFVALTPQSFKDDFGRAHIGGMRGIQNNFNIDGANGQSDFFGEQRGGVVPAFTFSQAAIKEFQVIPSSYNVQFGNASGGIINAITKSGTNDFQGEAWYYFRDQGFVNKDAFGRTFREFKVRQYGADLGGPFVKDAVHYFVSYDGQRRTDPFVRAWDSFPANRQADFEAKTGLSLANEVGDVPFTNDVDSILAKLDWQLSPEALLTIRNNYSTYTGENASLSTSTSRNEGRSNNGREKNRFDSAVATLNTVLSESTYNEATVQYAKEERPRYANNITIPEVNVREGNGAYFGQTNFLPNNLIERRTQLIDNLTYFVGNHSVKAGINLDFVNYQDVFYRYRAGSFQYATWNAFLNGNPPSRFRQGFSAYNGTVNFDANVYSAFLSDEWRATPRLTITIGARYDLETAPTPTETNPNFPQTGQIPETKSTWAPRLGFAWDPTGDGKTVVRGGIGTFFDLTPTLLYANALLNNGVRVIQVDLRCSSTTPCPSFPNLLSAPGSQPQSIFVFAPNFQTPRTRRASLGIEREVGRDFSLGTEVIASQTDHLERLLDLNQVAVGWTPFGTHYYSTTKAYPKFTQIGQFTSDARAHYFAVVLQARKRWSNRWLLDASYTYSVWRDDNSNERSVSYGAYNEGEDTLDIANDWGPGDYDIKHKFVLSGVVLLPLDIQVATIVTVRSGLPFTPGDARDLNNDGNFSSGTNVADRAYYNGVHYGRNSFRQPWYHDVDMRLSKIIRFGGGVEAEIIGEVFNLFRSANLTTDHYIMVDSSGNLRGDFRALDLPGLPRQYQAALKLRF